MCFSQSHLSTMVTFMLVSYVQSAVRAIAEETGGVTSTFKDPVGKIL